MTRALDRIVERLLSLGVTGKAVGKDQEGRVKNLFALSIIFYCNLNPTSTPTKNEDKLLASQIVISRICDTPHAC
jgi:hypothetical protein